MTQSQCPILFFLFNLFIFQNFNVLLIKSHQQMHQNKFCWCDLINCTKMHGEYNVKSNVVVISRFQWLIWA